MKQIKGYEDYLITLDGKLFSLKTMRFLSANNKTNAGYPRAELFNKDGGKWHLLHRLVAEAYLPNLENKPQVNHIDGVKHNSIVFNLEWTTASENQKHSYNAGLSVFTENMMEALRMGGRKNGAKNGAKAREKTSKFILDEQTGIYYTGINEAAFVLGLKPTTLKAKLNGQNKNLTTFKYV
jgi:hypothetical protein